MNEKNKGKPDAAARLEHVDRCLAMVLHYDEIEVIADVARELISEQADAAASDEEVP